MRMWRGVGVGIVSALVLAGCVEDAPLSPRLDGVGAGGRAVLTELSCHADLGAGLLECQPVDPAGAHGASAAVIGGQGEYVLLESSNTAYDEGARIFSADVRVRNLLTQTLGTSDGETVDPDGVRVFFIDEPVALPGGAGPVTVDNADGQATFTGPDQHYFQYTQALSPGRTSLPKSWQWQVPEGVTSFSFGVYVAAAVADEGSIVPGLEIDPETIAAGDYHSCGLSIDGLAYCWGRNGDGQLGIGTLDPLMDRPEPVVGPEGGPPLKFASISAGGYHTCGLTLDGEAWCWGYNLYGQLGTGDEYTYHTSPVRVSDPVEGETRYIAISAGYYFTCAVAVNGKAYCWGDNYDGQLGNGGFEDEPVPVAVSREVDGGLEFRAIAAGAYHTCALTRAGHAWCWGWGEYGQLGNDNEISTERPVAVAAPLGEPAPLAFRSISAGYDHTCGVAVNGKAYCWGSNDYGQIGKGAAEYEAIMRPTAVIDPAEGAVRYSVISAGDYYACALADGGRAYCWGNGSRGQLGIGESGVIEEQGLPVAVLPPDGETEPLSFAAISVSVGHTCASTIDGTAYCWGDGDYFRTGTGVAERVTWPYRVVSPPGGPVIFAGRPGPDGAVPDLPTTGGPTPLRRLPLLAWLGERQDLPGELRG